MFLSCAFSIISNRLNAQGTMRKSPEETVRAASEGTRVLGARDNFDGRNPGLGAGQGGLSAGQALINSIPLINKGFQDATDARRARDAQRANSYPEQNQPLYQQGAGEPPTGATSERLESERKKQTERELAAWAVSFLSKIERETGYAADWNADAQTKIISPILRNLPEGGPPEDKFIEEGKPPLFYGVDRQTGTLIENPAPTTGIYKTDTGTFYAEPSSLSPAEEAQLRSDNELFWKRKQNKSAESWNAVGQAEKEWAEYRKAGVVSWDQKPSNLGSVEKWNEIKASIDAKTRDEVKKRALKRRLGF